MPTPPELEDIAYAQDVLVQRCSAWSQGQRVGERGRLIHGEGYVKGTSLEAGNAGRQQLSRREGGRILGRSHVHRGDAELLAASYERGEQGTDFEFQHTESGLLRPNALGLPGGGASRGIGHHEQWQQQEWNRGGSTAEPEGVELVRVLNSL